MKSKQSHENVYRKQSILIPDNVLTKARNRGVNLMENLEYYYKNNSNNANMNFFEGDKEAIWSNNQIIIKIIIIDLAV